MPESEIKEGLNKLQAEVCGLRPLVLQVHEAMPRIAEAMEKLASVTEKLESNAEDHKRIHYRISDNEERIKDSREEFRSTDRERKHEINAVLRAVEDLGRKVDEVEDKHSDLHKEHAIQMASQKVLRQSEEAGFWAKVKASATSRLADMVTIGVVVAVVMVVVDAVKRLPIVEFLKEVL